MCLGLFGFDVRCPSFQEHMWRTNMPRASDNLKTVAEYKALMAEQFHESVALPGVMNDHA